VETRRRVRRNLPLVATTGAAAVVFLASLAVMAAIAGWSDVTGQLHAHMSFWFAVAFAAEVLAFLAYVLAYRSVAAVDGGTRLALRDAFELVAVGFGAFLAKGGAALDNKALRPRGGDKHDGEVRVLALDALEHAPLAPAACAAAVYLLVQGKRTPGLDFTIPWSTLVPIGAVLAFIGVRRRDRFTGKDGWRGKLGDTLEGITIFFRLARDWRTSWPGLIGSTVYWAGDVACLWACLKGFGAAPPIAPVILAHAVGYVLTRRTLPLAGAGIVEVLMPLTLVAAGAPFAGAILGVFAYRLFNLWLPLLPAVIVLPHLKRHFGGSFDALPRET
jgi:uncharacterized membrane protein YbhN (UPF0104 family)